MASTNIKHLNFYCVVEILNQIKKNCEVNKRSMLDIIKYADLINFALTCEWFRKVLRDWDYDLYDRLEIEKTYLSESDWVTVDFDELYKRFQKSTQKDKDVFWKTYINALQSNTLIKDIHLMYWREIYNRDHIEILDMVMSAIQNKQSINRLYINMEGCFLDRLPQLRHLDRLDVNAKMNASDLADCCEANQRLAELYFESNEIYGKLTDIVPHCKNLKQLTFMIKEHFNDSEYTQFAKLPSLKYLEILGAHESGSLCSLLKALATREPNTLEKLTIDSAPMDTEQILEACRIKTLKKFHCRFIDVKSFYLIIDYSYGNESLEFHFDKETDATDLVFLSNLTEFRSLRIFGKHKVGTLKHFFKAIAEKESPKLEILRNMSADMFNNDEILEVFKIKSLKTLQCGYFDLQPMEFPTQLPQISEITIEMSESLRNLFKAFLRFYEASKGNVSILSATNFISIDTNKRKLSLKMTPDINSTELVPLGRHHDSALASLFKAFASSKSTALEILSIENNISPIEVKEIAQLKTLRYLKCGFSDSQSLQHLKHLPKLELLKITSSHNFPDIADGVLSVLMGCSNEIRVIQKTRMIKFNKNLSRLKLINPSDDDDSDDDDSDDDVFDGDVYAPLAQLPQLRSLHIFGEHKLGSFKNFFKALALDKPPSLEEIISGKIISYEETLELSQIASLKKLACGFSDVECVELLIKLTNLQDLTIFRCPEGFVKEFLQEMTARERSNLQFLSLSDNLLTSEDIAAVARVNSLKILDCAPENDENIHLLANLMQLNALNIRADKCDSLVTLFHALSSTESKSLQSLSITYRYISYEEMSMVAKIKTLRGLCCTLIDKESIKLLNQLPELSKLAIELLEYGVQGIEVLAQLKKLTDLKIKSPKSGSLTGLFIELSSRTDPILQSLIINGIDLDSIEIDAIAQLKTLRRLQCGFDFVLLSSLARTAVRSDHKYYERLSDLTNLEVLEITSLFDLSTNSQPLLTILQKCHKLNVIEIRHGFRFKESDFINEALKILKTVRNPQVQEALELRVGYLAGITVTEIPISDISYLTICSLD